MPTEDENDRHRREEAERRAKRKASKASKSDAQREKDRARKEYRQNILKKHGQPHAEGNANKKQKKAGDAPSNSSEFQKLFEQRAQGFQIDFRFRNAPPRPPVGPCFVGQNLDAVLLQHAQQYRALNTVEVNHRWKLHNESDLGVPLAPSAMNLQSYKPPKNTPKPPLHQDDAELLEWTGSLGDTAAEELKFRRDRARAAARAAAAGRVLPPPPSKSAPSKGASASSNKKTKKAFSRVLDESMQTWMKKTTYLSNDYSRRVHDFTSLAKTKQQLAQDLEVKQEEIQKKRSPAAIAKSFDQSARVVHPTNKGLKPKKVFAVLPDSNYWGMPFTHLVVDKKPHLPEPYEQADMKNGLVTNVEKPDQNARMTCEVMAPSKRSQENEQEKKDYYETIQGFDLDVIPLKDEDSPHTNFCIMLDREKSIASYIPLPSRIQLSTGRPPQNPILRPINRRPESSTETTEREERLAEIDSDMAEKHHIDQYEADAFETASPKKKGTTEQEPQKQGNDDGEDDFGDDSDDSGDEALFGGGEKTIVAES
mmetsp:Transcript_24260/g.67274  ORF Transcript_24260/g.67274 Transcript_24260/m.67274 type:complete len:538 (+) Transcript_24260:79-1692(+)|eukprot:CAMPEP_0168735642 /NCGR_PEP_ID=MMETSP0724-20121128/9441_1 /TAXON_ID=265536 /ORGANISM="Amphiprora sp., Strain CCMP467" /LENGTH=537 /DNA_ID=CAMNT_0008782797 /DNA_START=22 /DNA_END=1635 /DNA_ORIENTATION=-